MSTSSALAYVVGEDGQGKGCLNLPPLTITAGSSGGEQGGSTISLGRRVWGCQGSASLSSLPLPLQIPVTAMAGEGELNRVIKDLQSKCACQPVPCQHIPCSVHLTLAMPDPFLYPGHGQWGVLLPGMSRESPCQPCRCCLLPSSLPAPGRWPCSLLPLLPSFIPGQVPLSL